MIRPDHGVCGEDHALSRFCHIESLDSSLLFTVSLKTDSHGCVRMAITF